RTSRDSNQIAGLHFDSDYRRSLRIHMKQAAALNNETHLVFVMPMFAAEFGEHGIQIGSLRADIDDVCGDVSAGRLQLVDFIGVGVEDFFLRSIGIQWVRRLPDVVLDTDFFQIFSYRFFAGNRSIFLGNSKYGHTSSLYCKGGL